VCVSNANLFARQCFHYPLSLQEAVSR